MATTDLTVGVPNTTPAHDRIEPSKSSLSYRLPPDRRVDPNDLVAIFELMGSLIAGGLPGTGITHIATDGGVLRIEVG